MEDLNDKYFLTWPEVLAAGPDLTGGKGWNLGRLDRYGFEIPVGGVLSTKAYLDFVTENNLVQEIEEISRSINLENIGQEEIEKKLNFIREKIKAGDIPLHIKEQLKIWLEKLNILNKPLAVRSSASTEDSIETSFAGVHESFLNVCSFKNILKTIKGCYASLWTVRAVSYRRKMGIPDNKVVPAVVIMEMLEAKASGIGFTCNPHTGAWNDMVISANYGLGESVVGGVIDPDEYHIDPKPALPEIRGKKIGNKEGVTVSREFGGTELISEGHPKYQKFINKKGSQVLSDEHIVEIGLLLLRVLDSLGEGQYHQDIEWVFNGETIILVQARPVTAIPRCTFSGLQKQADIWSNANLKDVMPEVQSTLNWSFYRYSLDNLLTPFFKAVGYEFPPGLKYVRLYQGRVYFNLSAMQWSYYDAFGITPKDLNASWGGHQPEIEVPDPKPYQGIAGLQRIWRMTRLFLIMTQSRRKAQQYVTDINSYVCKSLKNGFGHLDDMEVIRNIDERNRVFKEFAPKVWLVNGDMFSFLIKTLEKDFPGRGRSVANSLLAGKAKITSAEHGYRLLELAQIARNDPAARPFFNSKPFMPEEWRTKLPASSQFRQTFDEYLNKYGHRGIYELEIMNPRWREDQSYLLNFVNYMLVSADYNRMRDEQEKKGTEVWQKVRNRVPFYRFLKVKWLVSQAVKDAEMREMAKSEIVRLYEPVRMICQEIGRRLTERTIVEEQGDVYHCSWPELASILSAKWDGAGLKNLIDERKNKRILLEGLCPPQVLLDEEPKHIADVTNLTGEELVGMSISAGKASGKVRLISHPREANKLKAGDVLIAPSTDPAWTPLFLKSSALVMETGGHLSHGAIVAREYGLPAVANIPGVMRLLKDGQEITVDGDAGKIFLKLSE